MIWYLSEGLCISIRAQLYYQSNDLDWWKEVIETTVDAEVKASF